MSVYYGVEIPSEPRNIVYPSGQSAPIQVNEVEQVTQQTEADPYSFFPSIAPYKAAQLFFEEDKAKLGQ